MAEATPDRHEFGPHSGQSREYTGAYASAFELRAHALLSHLEISCAAENLGLQDTALLLAQGHLAIALNVATGARQGELRPAYDAARSAVRSSAAQEIA